MGSPGVGKQPSLSSLYWYSALKIQIKVVRFREDESGSGKNEGKMKRKGGRKGGREG